jgi:hypothetical protein
MPFEYEALRGKTQHRLVDFLHTELKIGPTFVQSAVLAREEGHMDHYAQAKSAAVKAADCVRRFKSQIADCKVRTEFGEKLAELDRLISTL